MIDFEYKNDELIDIQGEKPKYLEDNIKGSVFHDTYLNYLHLSYAKHYGVVVKPDFIWFTILNEISRFINKNPETYRHIFTTSLEKTDILVRTNDPVIIPVDLLLEKTFEHIPSELKKNFITLKFSTNTKYSDLAFAASFLESASPFYNYMMYACGFNKIKVLGTITDYNIIMNTILELKVVFKNTSIDQYLDTTYKLMNNIVNNFENKEFWKNIFYVESCGSGSQQIVKGWFHKLFADFSGYKMLKSFPKHISVIKYKNITTDMNYEMQVGMFSSVVEDGFLVTDFEFGINKIIDKY